MCSDRQDHSHLIQSGLPFLEQYWNDLWADSSVGTQERWGTSLKISLYRQTLHSRINYLVLTSAFSYSFLFRLRQSMHFLHFLLFATALPLCSSCYSAWSLVMREVLSTALFDQERLQSLLGHLPENCTQHILLIFILPLDEVWVKWNEGLSLCPKSLIVFCVFLLPIWHRSQNCHCSWHAVAVLPQCFRSFQDLYSG